MAIYSSSSIDNIFNFLRWNKDNIQVLSRSGKEVEEMYGAMDGGYGGTRTVFKHSVSYEQIKTHHLYMATINSEIEETRIHLRFP
jgi:hypothetical protein